MCLNPTWQCLNPTWQNSRCLPSSCWFRMNEWSCFLCKMAESKIEDFKMAAIIRLSQNDWVKFFVQNGWMKDGRIQDGWNHQVEWEWKSLSQIELVWVRVRVEWECFWVNLREDNKVSESKMAVSESKMAEFKMAIIIKLSQNERGKFFLCKMAESKMADFKMAAIIELNQNEQVKFFCAKWLNLRWQNSRWLPS